MHENNKQHLDPGFTPEPSKSLDTFYKGQTNNFSERLEYHNAGYEKFSAKGIPWTPIWATQKNTRKEALAFEAKLKNLSKTKLCLLMLKYNEDFINNEAMRFIQERVRATDENG